MSDFRIHSKNSHRMPWSYSKLKAPMSGLNYKTIRRAELFLQQDWSLMIDSASTLKKNVNMTTFAIFLILKLSDVTKEISFSKKCGEKRFFRIIVNLYLLHNSCPFKDFYWLGNIRTHSTLETWFNFLITWWRNWNLKSLSCLPKASCWWHWN